MKKNFVLIVFLSLCIKLYSQWDVNVDVVVPAIIDESIDKIYDPATVNPNQGNDIDFGSSQSQFDFGLGITSLITPEMSIFNMPVFFKFKKTKLNINLPYINRSEKFKGNNYKRNGLGDVSAFLSYQNFSTQASVYEVDWEYYDQVEKRKTSSAEYIISWKELRDIDYYLCIESRNKDFSDSSEMVVKDNHLIRFNNKIDGTYFYRIFAVFQDGEKIESNIQQVEVNQKKIKGIFILGIQFPTGSVENVANDYFIPLGSGTTNYSGSFLAAKHFNEWTTFSSLGFKYFSVYQYKVLYTIENIGYEQLTDNKDFDGLLFNFNIGTNYNRFKNFPLGIKLNCIYNTEGYTQYKRYTTYNSLNRFEEGKSDNHDDFFVADLTLNASYRLFNLVNLDFKIIIPVITKFNDADLNKSERNVVLGFGISYF